MTGSTVNDSLNSLYIGLPGSVGTSVGVAHLDTEGNAFFAKFALSHTSHLLACGFAVIFKKSLYKKRYLIYHCFQKKASLFLKFNFNTEFRRKMCKNPAFSIGIWNKGEKIEGIYHRKERRGPAP